ncbi:MULTISPECIES: hypothetical protein [unclassified Streptomyces]|uniref:hypothetical protein n=1 Tax=unclassified Streptomyces TaxID=2593676 RepID=UPI000DB9F17E|nr:MULTISPECIES: hypothetical protein [unclassified Streptomyces]MYT70002.1 hypothetical protein [Streptomyces sp. SID8367]RAJ88578.1 hypothetical protein K377_02033 [Streptomyces sp. PsTaAH-137]
MRQPTAVSPRRSRAAFTALAAAALITAAAAAPAVADEPAENDTLWISAPYDLVLPGADEDGNVESQSVDVQLYHDNTNNSVSGGTLTVDAGELAGIADVTWPANCTEEAGSSLKATCSFGTLDGSPWITAATLGIRTEADAPADASAYLHYSASADSSFGTLEAYPADTHITVANGPDLGLNQLPFNTKVDIDSDVAQPVRLTNSGNRTADRTILTLFASHGLDLAHRYGNCTYADTDQKAGTTAVCVLDRAVAPGQTYDLSPATAVRTTGAALYERFDYQVATYTDEAYEQALAGRPFVRGSGEDFVPEQVTASLRAADTDDLNLEDNYRARTLTAANTADLRATAPNITGAAVGDTVTARIGVLNRGPAWVASLGAGASVATVDVTLPAGTTVTKKPAMCEHTGGVTYVCRTPILQWEKDRTVFPFKLRIDSADALGASGTVATRNNDPELTISAFDPNLKNNSRTFTISG